MAAYPHLDIIDAHRGECRAALERGYCVVVCIIELELGKIAIRGCIDSIEPDGIAYTGECACDVGACVEKRYGNLAGAVTSDCRDCAV